MDKTYNTLDFLYYMYLSVSVLKNLHFHNNGNKVHQGLPLDNYCKYFLLSLLS